MTTEQEKDLRRYLNNEIIPRYNDDRIDVAHRKQHIKEVLATFKELYEISDLTNEEYLMCITAIVYHDLGLVEGRERHHIVSANIVRKDKKLLDFFTKEEIEVIAVAIEEHRASAKNPPKSKLGPYVADSDRSLADEEDVVRRSYEYQKAHNKGVPDSELVKKTHEHMKEKYSTEGYLILYTKEANELYTKKRKWFSDLTEEDVARIVGVDLTKENTEEEVKPRPSIYKLTKPVKVDDKDFMIDQEEIKAILDVDPEAIGKEELVYLFSKRMNKNKDGVMPPILEVYYKVKLKKGDLPNVKSDITTTVGKIIFNIFTMLPVFGGTIEFLNMVIDESNLKKFEEKLVHMSLRKEIDATIFYGFMERVVKLSYMPELFVPGISTSVLTTNKKVEAKKKELLSKYKDAVDEGDHIKVSNNVEKELIKMADEELSKDPSNRLFRSGGKPNISNNYKNMSLMLGPTKNLSTGKFETVSESYGGGLSLQKYDVLGNAAIAGNYARGVGTGEGGAIAKFMFAGLQSVKMDKPGSDCGSKRYKKRIITEKEKKNFYYTYIIDNGKLVRLDPEIIDKYINKEVRMRSTIFCEKPDGLYCSKCAGDLFHMMGITNIGLTSTIIGNSLMGKSMAAMHDSTIKTKEIDFFEFFR